MPELILDLLDNQIVFAALITACGGLLAYALIYPLLSGEMRGAKRLEAISVTTDRTVRAKGIELGMRKKQVAATLKDLDAKQKANNRIPLEGRIKQAGLDLSLRNFVLLCVAAAIVFGAAGFAVKKTLLAVVICVPIGGLVFPFVVLNYLRKKRIKKFVAEFPNAVDVIVRGIKSGLPIGDCLRIIANEAAEPVRSEFRHIVDVQQLGVNVADACTEMYQRVPVTEANFFGIVIQIQQKTGGNLSEVLGSLSKVLRERRKMKGKIIAMSTEATASAAIIASLPFIVGSLVYLMTPAYIELLWLREAGQRAMMFSAVWMTLGIVVMKKMIHFDF